MGEDPDAYLNCTNLTTDQFRSISLTRGITGIICAVLCFLTLVVILGTKTWQNIRQRLFLYLTISTVAYMVTLSMHLEHYYHYFLEDRFCQIVGFFDQYTAFVQLLFIFGITLFLDIEVISAVCCHKQINQLPLFQNKRLRRSILAKVVFEFLVFILPVLLISLVALIPWFSGASYGETGPWCWIRSLDVKCKKSEEAMWEQMGLWYIPFAIVSVSSLGFIVMMLVVFLWVRFGKNEETAQRIRRIAAEILLLVGFMVAYCILCVIEIVCDTVAIKHNTYGVWMLYAISTPISGAMIPFGFLIYIMNRKALKKCYQRNNDPERVFSDVASGATPTPSDATPSETQVQFSQSLEYGHGQSDESEPLLRKTERCCIL